MVTNFKCSYSFNHTVLLTRQVTYFIADEGCPHQAEYDHIFSRHFRLRYRGAVEVSAFTAPPREVRLSLTHKHPAYGTRSHLLTCAVSVGRPSLS